LVVLSQNFLCLAEQHLVDLIPYWDFVFDVASQSIYLLWKMTTFFDSVKPFDDAIDHAISLLRKFWYFSNY